MLVTLTDASTQMRAWCDSSRGRNARNELKSQENEEIFGSGRSFPVPPDKEWLACNSRALFEQEATEETEAKNQICA